MPWHCVIILLQSIRFDKHVLTSYKQHTIYGMSYQWTNRGPVGASLILTLVLAGVKFCRRCHSRRWCHHVQGFLQGSPPLGRDSSGNHNIISYHIISYVSYHIISYHQMFEPREVNLGREAGGALWGGGGHGAGAVCRGRGKVGLMWTADRRKPPAHRGRRDSIETHLCDCTPLQGDPDHISLSTRCSCG